MQNGLDIGAGHFAARAGELRPPGFRPVPPGVHALVGGKLVARPGEAVEGGTVVIRDGLIQAVGKDITPPADARVWDMKGATIYAGFIDAYLVSGATNKPVSTSDSEPIDGSFTAPGERFFGVPGGQTDSNAVPGYQVARITPEYRAVRDYSPTEKTLAPLREAGFTAGVIAPPKDARGGRAQVPRLAYGCDRVHSPKHFRRPALRPGPR